MVAGEWTRPRNASRRIPFRLFTIHAFPRRLAEDIERLAVLHRLPVLGQDRLDDAILVGFDLVQELHGLDDAEGVAGLDRLPDLDEGLRPGGGAAVEGADHWRADDVA